jgi:acyl carrier protein
MDGTPPGAASPSVPNRQWPLLDTPGGSTDRAMGIDPPVGTDMLLALLSARTPEQVVVRPFVGGRPVPLPDPATEAEWYTQQAATESTVAARLAPSSPTVPGAAPTTPFSAPLSATDPAASSVVSPATSSAPPAAAPAPPDPSSPVGDRLRQLWSHTLGIDDIGLDDDFFDLGGNSLSAIELMSQVRDVFDVELTIGFLFEAPTLSELTELLEQQAKG